MAEDTILKGGTEYSLTPPKSLKATPFRPIFFITAVILLLAALAAGIGLGYADVFGLGDAPASQSAE